MGLPCGKFQIKRWSIFVIQKHVKASSWQGMDENDCGVCLRFIWRFYVIIGAILCWDDRTMDHPGSRDGIGVIQCWHRGHKFVMSFVSQKRCWTLREVLQDLPARLFHLSEWCCFLCLSCLIAFGEANKHLQNFWMFLPVLICLGTTLTLVMQSLLNNIHIIPMTECKMSLLNFHLLTLLFSPCLFMFSLWLFLIC